MESIEVKTEMSLSVLDQREASLMALAASAKDLTIVGPEDKMGYKLVREKRIELKAERVQVQNDGFCFQAGWLSYHSCTLLIIP